MIVGVWNPRKRKAWKLLRAYCEAAGGRVAQVDTVRASRVDHHVFYGVDDRTRQVWERVRSGGFTYIDNGYFRSKYHGAVPAYYRITRGAPQHSGIGRSDGERWAALGIELAPWRTDGDHVVVALQSAWWFERHAIIRDEWVMHVVETVGELTGRPVVVRDKPSRESVLTATDDPLHGAWCVVTHSSNVAVDAIVRGVPAIVLGESAARPMAGVSLDQVAAPPTPAGREMWAAVLADNQWTRAEIASGLALEMLDKQRARGVRRGHG